MRKDLVDRLIPGNIPTIEEIEKRYPKRAENLVVTRYAPSPTGQVHIGNIFTALVTERIAHSNNGIFYVRIEDTDTKREVEGAEQLILNALSYCNIKNDEGPQIDGTIKGNYAPYTQSKRGDIYKAYIKKLLEEDKAYPCFCTPEETEAMREEQTKSGIRPGYYGLWAKCRKLSEERIIQYLDEGKKFVIRFRSNGSFSNKISFVDIIRGKRILPENDLDVVILKNDGLPTYHFAHAVDDHLMGTTIVTRGDEWLISTPLHIQLFEALGFTPPQYLHLAPIQKIDGDAKRKLSKRKDPEASFSYYIEKGYPKEAILDYLMNLANSNFEDFRKKNPNTDLKDFPFNMKGLGSSGPLLDFNKLNSISRDFIATLSANELYERFYIWAKEFDKELAKKIEENSKYFISIFEIERKDCDRVRKDFINFSTVWSEIEYFFNLNFKKEDFKEVLPNINLEDAKQIVEDFIKSYNENSTKEEWFENVKNLASKYNYATNGKEYQANPEKYNGGIADFVAIFRYLLTGRKNSPDLYSIMKVLGKEESFKRLNILQ